MGFGHKTDMKNYECKGYLLGQLGKNYSDIAKKANLLSGNDLFRVATVRAERGLDYPYSRSFAASVKMSF